MERTGGAGWIGVIVKQVRVELVGKQRQKILVASVATSASDVWRDCDGRVRLGSGRRCGVDEVGCCQSDRSERSRSRLDGEFVGGGDGKDGRDDGSDDEKSESVIDVGHVKVCAREVGYGGSRYGVGVDGGSRQGAGRSASVKLGVNCNDRFLTTVTTMMTTTTAHTHTHTHMPS